MTKWDFRERFKTVKNIIHSFMKSQFYFPFSFLELVSCSMMLFMFPPSLNNIFWSLKWPILSFTPSVVFRSKSSDAGWLTWANCSAESAKQRNSHFHFKRDCQTTRIKHFDWRCYYAFFICMYNYLIIKE